MKIKKYIALMVLVVLGFMQVSVLFPINAYAESDNESKVDSYWFENHYRYYYAQLNDKSKKIYDAMVEMYKDGTLKAGNKNYDLISNGKINAELVDAYKKGNNELIVAFETARDAFYLDYPEVFFINIEKYSLRITSDANGYHVWLGTGNNDSYYMQGFNSVESVNNAELELNNAINKIVEGTEKFVKEYSGEELIKKEIEYVHNEVVLSATYKLDNECKDENKGHIRTPYGALIAKEAVCEGDSKSVKIILDKLGIPCILVRGAFKSEDVSKSGPHMWNYVQINDKWYAVDATFDDNEGSVAVYNDYLLAGLSTMNEEHFPNGIMSAPEFEFVYPTLESEDYGLTQAYDYNGLVVNYGKVVGESGMEEVTGGKFIISYNGMGIEQAKMNNCYFLVKYIYDDGTISDWFYMESLRDYVEFYAPGIITERENDFVFIQFSSEYMEFAVTDEKYTEPVKFNQIYKAGEEHIIAQTGKLENAYGNLKPAPNFCSASPYIGTKLSPGKKQHIKLVYNEKLQLAEGKDKVTLKVSMQRDCDPETAVENSKVENFKWDGESTIEFDFTPSDKWGDNSVIYNFYPEGLIGSWSQRILRPAYYYVQESFGCTYNMSKSGSWRAYARPELVDTGDIDVTDWEFSDGKVESSQATILNGLTDKMALVVSKPTETQENEMNKLIENSGEKLINSEVYNINLVLCNKKVLKTANGQKVTVYLGFPKGYGPNDAGVTFKAYHFSTSSDGKVTSVDEIDCVVTPYGLLVTCDAFSPFAVAVVENSSDNEDTSKSYVVSAEANGKIEGLKNNIVKVEKDQSNTYSIKADAGYQIDTLKVFGKEIKDAKGKDSFDLTIGYDDVIEEEALVEVSFVANSVVQKEEQRGETLVVQEFEGDFEITMEINKEKVVPGEGFEITAHLNNIKNIEDGIIAISGQLYINKDLLEIDSRDNQDILIGENGWDLSSFNNDNFKFVADNNSRITENSKLFTVHLKVKENVEVEQITSVSLKDVFASGGNGLLKPINEASQNVNIVMKEAEYIKSDKYKIDDELNIISRILPKTTVAEFITNIETNTTIEFLDKEGNKLTDNQIIATGMTLNVGNTFSYKMSVIGDINEEGTIDLDDLAKLKLHLIEKNKITDTINFMAADIDDDKEITINDLAIMKLVLIEKRKL